MKKGRNLKQALLKRFSKLEVWNRQNQQSNTFILSRVQADIGIGVSPMVSDAQHWHTHPYLDNIVRNKSDHGAIARDSARRSALGFLQSLRSTG